MSRLFRRAVAAPAVVVALAATALGATAAPAFADDANTLTVVGTSDVFDSNLVQTVIKPGFEAAYPGVTLNYVSKGTGAAIAYAEAGSASALIVHAAALENQFVDQGYSLEQYGRAIFWGDYVLLGPASDPAGVLSGTTHDIVGAFQKVAKAGAKGKADFVSRGGTPGTTVQEHALWDLSTGVPLCQVSDLNGGGKAPSTVGGDCPGTPANPSWYHTTGLTQGPNILAGDACNFPNANGGNDCYVFTDKGTFQYLRSTGQINAMQIVTQKNASTKAGGETALVNSFHAYGIDPAKFAGNPNVQINATGAQNFLQWITSPAAQSAIGAFLASDPDGAPFRPSAAPQAATNLATLPSSVAAGAALSVTGTLSNAVPGTPTLSGVTVSLNFRPSAAPSSPQNGVATAVTAANGTFRLTYRPSAAGTYTVSTPALTKIENADLNPQFGDLLAPMVTAPSSAVAITGSSVAFRTLAVSGRTITGSAGFTPADTVQPGQLVLYAAQGSNALAQVGTPLTIPVGNRTLPFRFALPAKGVWNVQLHYVNNGVIPEGVSDVRSVTVS